MHTHVYLNQLIQYKMTWKNASKMAFNQGFVLKSAENEPILSQKSGKKGAQNLEINQGFVSKVVQKWGHLDFLNLSPPSAC